ncbi:PH domain-containing protein [Flavobacterium sp.]|uniref:PH domain-containing protein n=1 Tax=Flavobacterium sp. TaxID=239 RepID=UPI00286B21FE|nr:PH domain-containing protein [Flavobacterium sp.]
MENFTNETIDTTQLPKFEEVLYSKLHASYWKIILIQIAIVFVIISAGFVLLINNAQEEIAPFQIKIGLGILSIFILIVWFSRIGFNKKGFAFRQHDVLFRHGVIATNTLVIPYNRIQHVSLHEGIISRFYDLAKIEIFTAGGNSSDIEIPGIEKTQAENIKQLLMGRIQKEL